MAIQTAAGSSIAISTTAFSGVADAAGFGAKTYTVISEVTTIPAFGKTYNVINHNPLATRYTKKLKGSYNNGSVTLDYALDTADAGQALLFAAVDNDASFAYRVTMQNGTIYYFTAQATSSPIEVGSVDSIVKATTVLEIDSNIVRV
jgi:hypothetical protein